MYLKQFNKETVFCDPLVKFEINRFEKDAQHKCSPKILDEKPFTSQLEEVIEKKITYLNINWLFEAKHIECLRNDHNLSHSDLICISETKLGSDVKNNSITLKDFTDFKEKDVIEVYKIIETERRI